MKAEKRDVRCPECGKLLGRRGVDGKVVIRFSGKIGFISITSGAIGCDCGVLVTIRQPDVLIVSGTSGRW